MLKQIIDVFRNIYGENFDKVIIDGYVPVEGTYIIVEPDSEGNLTETSRTEIEIDKKTKEVNRMIEKFNLISKLDYNSKLIDMNKPIDPKKIIHSNNYLSFFVKKESLSINKLTDEIIDTYYSILANPIIKYGKKAKTKELYEKLEQEIGNVDLEKLNKIKKWIKENIKNLDINVNKKNYLKIFFLFDENDFVKEGKRYLIPNIYNNNDFNIVIGGDIYGLPNNNMGLNSKKTYLENKTRKAKVPYLVDQEEALLQKKVFDYFLNQASQGFYNIYVGDQVRALKDGELLDKEMNGFYIRIKKGKEAEIHDFDVISKYRPTLDRVFEFKNVLDVDYDILYKNIKDNVCEYGKKKTLMQMQLIINEILFSRYLVTNYFSDDISVKDNDLVQSIRVSREKLFSWFYKGNDNNVWVVLNNTTKSLIKSSMEKGYISKAMNQFNLRYSLKEYFLGGEENMADIILNVKETLRNKISQNITGSIESEKEYFFAVGQLVSFFMSKSNGKNKPLALVNPIIAAKSDEVIKNRLKQLFKKYNHALYLDKDIRFKNLYSMILGYEVQGNINEDLIIAGYLNSNLIYEKKES